MKRMKKKKVMLVVLLVLSLCLSATASNTVEAANKKTTTSKKKSVPKIKSVTLKMNNKKLTKKTITLTTGQTAKLKAVVSPAKAAKRIDYTINIKDCDWNMAATLTTTGKITTQHAGTTRFLINVYGYDGKKKQIPLTVKVVDPKPKKTTTVKHTHTWNAHTITETYKSESGALVTKAYTDYYTCTCGAKLNVK